MMNKLPDDPDSLKKMFDLSQEQYKEGGNEAPKFTEEEVSYPLILLSHYIITLYYFLCCNISSLYTHSPLLTNRKDILIFIFLVSN